MSLTEGERNLIAQRAGGSYAIIPNIRQIVQEQVKNRNPDDAVFLEFARLVIRKSFEWDEYEVQAKSILAIIPFPFGRPKPLIEKIEPADDLEIAPTKKKEKARRAVTCGICGGEGHNARTCPNKTDTATVTHTDGIERLSPGFDPNPPKVEEVEKRQHDSRRSPPQVVDQQRVEPREDRREASLDAAPGVHCAEGWVTS